MKIKTTCKLITMNSGSVALHIFRGGIGTDQPLELKTYDAFWFDQNYRQRARRLVDYMMAYLRRFDLAQTTSASQPAIIDQDERAGLEQRLYEAEMLEGSEMEY